MLSYAKGAIRSRFVRSVVVVATGTAAAQAINMVFAPIITRLYGPEAFGILGTFTAILAILTPFAALSYPIAIVLPKKDSEAVGLVKLSVGLAVVVSLVVGLMLIVFKTPVVRTLNLEAIEPFVFLLPLAMLFSACMAVATQWIIRKKLFKVQAKVAVLQALWLNSAKSGLGFFNPTALGLVMLAAVGSALHAVMLSVGIKKQATNEPFWDTEMASYKTLAWQYRDFVYYRTPQVFLNAISQSMPVLMLASFFGPRAAGFYSLARLILALPTQLIGQSVASVFYPRVTEAIHAQEDAWKLILTATLGLAAVGIIPFGIVMTIGPWIFSYVFGAEWVVAGQYSQWLALWLYASFINRPSVGAIPVLGLQRFFLGYEIVSVILRALSLSIGFLLFESALIAIAVFSVAGCLLNIFLIFLTLLKVKACDKKETLR